MRVKATAQAAANHHQAWGQLLAAGMAQGTNKAEATMPQPVPP